MAIWVRCIAAALAAFLVLDPTLALAQDLPDVALGSTEIYETSLKALTVLFVAAVLIESALAIVFNWRVFLTYFSLRGMKTILSVIVSYLVVESFGIDVVASLFDAYTTETVESGFISKILTALVLSGGSSGVNSLMAALGYRDRNREEAVNPNAPPTQAWLAVRVNRVKAKGPIEIHVTEVTSPSGDPAAIAGTVGFKRPSILELLLRNANRFPSNGGYVVEPNKVYKIDVVGYDAEDNPVPNRLTGKEYRFAPRAIVDFEVTL